jgi:hypothetical protein
MSRKPKGLVCQTGCKFSSRYEQIDQLSIAYRRREERKELSMITRKKSCSGITLIMFSLGESNLAL